MSQRRFKPYLRDNYQKTIQQIKTSWPQPITTHLQNGSFYPVSPTLTDLFRDDNDSTKTLPGEKLVLSLAGVHYIWADWAECTGTLQVTNYRLLFVADLQQPSNPSLFSTDPPTTTQKTTTKNGGSEILPVYRQIPSDISVPLSTIEKVDHDPKLKPLTTSSISPVMFIDIICKDIREYRFGMPKQAEGSKALALIASYAFDTVPHHLYAFSLPKSAFFTGEGHNPAKSLPIENEKVIFPFQPNPSSLTGTIPPHLDGWRFYNPILEYKRMGIPNENFRVSTTINADYTFSPTYPSILVIPQNEHLTEAEYRLSAKFRSKARVPALTWKNPTGEQTIWRCSQPATGIGFNRSQEDEKLLEFIGKVNKYNSNLTIIDCRPRANAYANNIKGFGCESESNYTTAQLRFMNIENIHEVRKSFKRLRKACCLQKYDQTFLTELHQSLWLKYIQDILRATAQVINLIDTEGQSCLIRCSDGWDRTSQLCSLTKLCLDPYYRTIRGFTTLIDHDWLSFGHKFHDRYGHFSKDIKDERSPIFIQFLDCVAQLLIQFPRHFEFTSEFLIQIALHSFSSRFGTFLMNNEKERQFFQLKKGQPIQRVADVSISLWTYLFCCPGAVQGHFYNPFYSPGGQGNPNDVFQHELYSNIIPQSFFSTDQQPLPGVDSIEGLKYLRQEPIEGCLTTGTVIYPSYSMMKLTLWSDYWFRFHFDLSNEFFHYQGINTTGNLYPGGATTSSLRSPQLLFNTHFQLSQLISGSLHLRLQPQQLLLNQLQSQQYQNDDKLVQLLGLLYEKDLMLEYYRNKHGPIDQLEQEKLLYKSQLKQNEYSTLLEHQRTTNNNNHTNNNGQNNNTNNITTPPQQSTVLTTTPQFSQLFSTNNQPSTTTTPISNNNNNNNGQNNGQNNNNNNGTISYTVLTPQEENALYIQQQQQYLLHRASYCIDPTLLQQLQQQSQPQLVVQEIDPLTGLPITTTLSPHQSSSSSSSTTTTNTSRSTILHNNNNNNNNNRTTTTTTPLQSQTVNYDSTDFIPTRFGQQSIISPAPTIPHRPKRPQNDVQMNSSSSSSLNNNNDTNQNDLNVMRTNPLWEPTTTPTSTSTTSSQSSRFTAFDPTTTTTTRHSNRYQPYEQSQQLQKTTSIPPPPKTTTTITTNSFDDDNAPPPPPPEDFIIQPNETGNLDHDSDDDNNTHFGRHNINNNNMNDDDEEDAEQMESRMTMKMHAMDHLNQHLTQRLQSSQHSFDNGQNDKRQKTQQYFDDDVYDDDDNTYEIDPQHHNHHQQQQQKQMSPNSKFNSLLNDNNNKSYNNNGILSPGGNNNNNGNQKKSLFDLEDDDDTQSGIQVNNVFGQQHNIFSSPHTNQQQQQQHHTTSNQQHQQNINNNNHLSPNQTISHLSTSLDDDNDDDDYESHQQLKNKNGHNNNNTSQQMNQFGLPNSLIDDPFAHVLPDGEYDEEDQE